MAWTWMIVFMGLDHCGIAGMLLLKVVLSILWMRMWRRVTVSLFRSGWSWGWTWMMNAEVTVENRLACMPGQHIHV